MCSTNERIGRASGENACNQNWYAACLTIGMVGRVTSLDLVTLRQAYREQSLTPSDVVAAVR